MIDKNFNRTYTKSGKEYFVPLVCEWLTWIGQPMLYDGGLCVNRTSEEHKVSDEMRYRSQLCV